MNEGTGSTDLNLVDNQTAAFSGSVIPTWFTYDPPITFNGGNPLNSYLNAGTDSNLDQLPTSQMTIIAKVFVNTLAAAGIAEKNDNNAIDGFIFGWSAAGALRLTVEKPNTNMRVVSVDGAVTAGQWVQVAVTWDGTVGTAAAAHLFVNGTEQTIVGSGDGADNWVTRMPAISRFESALRAGILWRDRSMARWPIWPSTEAGF